MNALERLKKENEESLLEGNSIGDLSLNRKRETSENGQHPYAVILTCSDSRVIPEAIFHAGIGDLFVIRVAGNVIGEDTLASIEYGLTHLGAETVLVLGHTHCGAVTAAIEGEAHGHIAKSIQKIQHAIHEEKDIEKAVLLNAISVQKEIRSSLGKDAPVEVGIYDIETGIVSFYEPK